MKATVLYGARDIRFEERPEPKVLKPTDAIIRLSVTCVCGSDLWPYRGIQKIEQPTPMGHEYCGIVEEVGSAVKTVKPGQFVIGSFCISDNTCPNCRAGYQSGCQQLEFMNGAQAPYARVPLADGTLVALPEVPSNDLLPNLLAVSDVLGTGWFAADAANVKPGATTVVVGDGALGLLGVLAAKQLGAESIIAISRHAPRQRLAREFGATDIVTERGDEGIARIKELTKGIGTDSTLECVGSLESMMQATPRARAARSALWVFPHDALLDLQRRALISIPPPFPGALKRKPLRNPAVWQLLFLAALLLRLRAPRMPLQVLNVTATTQCSFVRHQVIQGDEVHRDAEEAPCGPFSPRLGKADACDFGENVDPDRRDSDLIDHLLVGECFGGYLIVVNGSAELLEHLHNADRVLP